MIDAIEAKPEGLAYLEAKTPNAIALVMRVSNLTVQVTM